MSGSDPTPSALVESLEADELAAAVIGAAIATRRTIATAESLTGGLLGAVLTGLPGASAAYRGGLITYATDLKAGLAGVPSALLDRVGAVSAETARALAAGAAERCSAQIAVALTGVAGPATQEGHPAGTVFCGWYAESADGPTRAGAELLSLGGPGRGRSEIRAAAVAAALRRLRSLLQPE